MLYACLFFTYSFIYLTGHIVRLYLTIIFLIILLTIAVIFGSQNNQIVVLNYLIAQTEISVAAAVSLFTSIGFILGLFTATLFRLFKSLKAKHTN